MTALWHVLLWSALWLFWVVVARHNHPTLLLDALATALLLAAYAAAVYLNWLKLVPGLWRTNRHFAYLLALLLSMTALTLVAVLAITATYDVLWGPDPARFGFWVNFGLDFSGMTVHLLASALLVWLIRRKRSTGRRD